MIINMTSGGVVPERIIDAQTITPGTENIVFADGTYLRGPLTILGDKDFKAENIPADVNLFGVQGTRPPDAGANVWQRGHYTPAQNLSVKFSYVSSTQIKLSHTGIPISKLVGVKICYQTEDRINSSYYTVLSETQLRQYRGGSLMGNYNFTYDESTGILTLPSKPTYPWTSTEIFPTFNVSLEEVFDIIDHIVNDDLSAYPSEGLHTDGLYYRLLAAVSSANVMSLTNRALENVQQDYRDQIETEVSNA